ncbi:hypothetical protein AB1M95_02320 [Sulfitobacter sp. LCG007]
MRVFRRLLLFPFRLMARLPGLLLVLLLVASLLFNIATLTVSGVYVAASTALNAMGVTTVAAREAGAKLVQRRATTKIGRETTRRVTRRVQRGAARNIASVGGEAIPILGIAVIAGALALEVEDACTTAADMAGLEAALAADGSEEELESVRQAAYDGFDCRTLIPEYDDLPGKDAIWAAMKNAPSAAYEQARAAGIGLAEFDWAGTAGSVVESLLAWAASFFDTGGTPETLLPDGPDIPSGPTGTEE